MQPALRFYALGCRYYHRPLLQSTVDSDRQGDGPWRMAHGWKRGIGAFIDNPRPVGLNITK
eukprot:6180698-Pleurochrysis_carterae.AAC.1